MMKKKQPLVEEAGTLLQPGYLSKVEEDVVEEKEKGEEKKKVVAALPPEAELSRPRNGLQTLQQHRGCKRRNSLNSGFKHPGFKRRRRAASDCDPVLPSNFLLGGNIFDPLNLNSLLDEEVNRALNAETPKSSPLPCRNRDPVEILVPRDITDPLCLNRDSEVLPSPLKLGRKRRHRHCHHPVAEDGAGAAAAATTAIAAATTAAAATTTAAAAAGTEPEPYELNTAINCRDEIVSPVLRGTEQSGGGGGGRHRKRRRTCSKSEPGKVHPHAEDERVREREGEGKKVTPEKGKGGGGNKGKMPPSFPSKQRRFQYGNYSKYYGYRNPGRSDDPRLDVLKPAWFTGKDILDLGCNSGHLTLSIAKDLKPSRIVGVDIDGGLVHSARQNIRHFLSEDVLPSRKQHAHFPVSLAKCKGPIAAPPVALALDRRLPDFPNNVTFVQGNYVLEKDELLETQRPEYDVILCLSLTKWIHLNWGDEGLKRMFKRIFRHLRPGGIFILEPQPWSSYGKRRKLTETIYRNYYKIILKPEQFTSYLLSPEVGFSSYELVGTPQSTSKGCGVAVQGLMKGSNVPFTSFTRTAGPLRAKTSKASFWLLFLFFFLFIGGSFPHHLLFSKPMENCWECVIRQALPFGCFKLTCCFDLLHKAHKCVCVCVYIYIKKREAFWGCNCICWAWVVMDGEGVKFEDFQRSVTLPSLNSLWVCAQPEMLEEGI